MNDYMVFFGMRARQRALDVVANNIANASTSGFKSDRLLYESVEAEFGRTQAPAANTGTAHIGGDAPKAHVVSVNGTTDFSAGSVLQTGRPLDIALGGQGFLAVRSPRGERYTRGGSLTLDASGQLVTQSGDLVLGYNGPITVPPGEVSISTDGTVSVNGKELGKLKLVRFENRRAELLKEGASLFVATKGARPAEDTSATVTQGALETSNVNSIEQVVAMIQITREFDLLQRSMSMKLEGEAEIGKI